MDDMDDMDEENGFWAYCPRCDIQHLFDPSPSGSYYCPFTPVFRISRGKYEGLGHHGEGWCERSVHFRPFGDSSTCEGCGLPVGIAHHEILVPMLIARIWKQVRGELDVSAQADGHLKNTFPTQFAEITAESNTANAAALAPHLPPVLVRVVADYFG